MAKIQVIYRATIERTIRIAVRKRREDGGPMTRFVRQLNRRNA